VVVRAYVSDDFDALRLGGENSGGDFYVSTRARAAIRVDNGQRELRSNGGEGGPLSIVKVGRHSKLLG
jgi:hypothetical protein